MIATICNISQKIKFKNIFPVWKQFYLIGLFFYCSKIFENLSQYYLSNLLVLQFSECYNFFQWIKNKIIHWKFVKKEFLSGIEKHLYEDIWEICWATKAEWKEQTELWKFYWKQLFTVWYIQYLCWFYFRSRELSTSSTIIPRQSGKEPLKKGLSHRKSWIIMQRAIKPLVLL